MVNLVIVSHSARLGEGVGELARQMLMNDGCKLAIAAGIDDPASPIGTDPIKVMEAIESVADADHVLVMMDIGSALLSAETALDLLDPAIAAKVRLCAAPLVEGTLAATVSAAAGADIDKVIEDAMNALEAKRVQLGLPSQPQPPSLTAALADDRDARSVSVVIQNPNGLHVRPASKLVAALAGFNADLVLEKEGKCVTPDSLNQIALLQVRRKRYLKVAGPRPGRRRRAGGIPGAGGGELRRANGGNARFAAHPCRSRSGPGRTLPSASEQRYAGKDRRHRSAAAAPERGY